MSRKSLFLKQNKLGEEIKKLCPLFLKGSVVKISRLCGKKYCRCFTEGKKHVTWCLSVKFKGKSKIFSFPQDKLEDAKKWSKNYQKLKSLINKLTFVNIQILRQKTKGGHHKNGKFNRS